MPGEIVTLPKGIPHTFARSDKLGDSVLRVYSWLEPPLNGTGGQQYFEGLAGLMRDSPRRWPLARGIQSNLLACEHRIYHAQWWFPAARCTVIQAIAPFLGFKASYSEYRTC